MPRTSRKSRSTAGQRPSIVSGEMRNSSTMSSATRPLPREMSSSASSLLPIADAPVISTPISSTSRNTPCSVVDSASTRARYSRITSTMCGDGCGDVKSATWCVLHWSSRCCGTARRWRRRLPTSSVVNRRSIERCSSSSGSATQVGGLRGAEELDAERVDEVHVADLAHRRLQPGIAAQHAAAALAAAMPQRARTARDCLRIRGRR